MNVIGRSSPNGAADTKEAAAFREFREGATPADLVERGICDPGEARTLRAEFNELAEGEYLLLTAEEVAEREREAAEAASEATAEAWRDRVDAAAARAERAARADAYERGQEAAERAAWEEARAMMDRREERIKAEAREQIEALAEHVEELEAAVETATVADDDGEAADPVAELRLLRALEARGERVAEANGEADESASTE